MPGLRPLSGRDPEVAAYVAADPRYRTEFEATFGRRPDRQALQRALGRTPLWMAVAAFTALLALAEPEALLDV